MAFSPDFERAVALLTSGVAEQAIPLLEREKERSPGAWEVTHALARALDLAGQKRRAVSFFEEAHRQAPSEPEPACDLALFHLAKEELDLVHQILQPAAAAHPEHPRLNLFLAMALAKSSAGKARAHAAKALQSGDADTQEQARALYSVLAQEG